MSLLDEVGNALHRTFSLIPLSVVRSVFIAVLLLTMLWVLRLPNPEITPTGRTARWDDNLKLWAWLALALQVAIYCVC